MANIFSQEIQRAIQFAITAHTGQTRKGKDIPYITHPLTVALILARAGAEEEVVIAGILHDTVEDSDGAIALSDIEEKFGEAVASLVRHVTEENKSLPWEERKQIALTHIYEMPYSALLLKSADVLHNLTELVSDVEKQGDVVFEKFNAPKERKLEQQQKLVEAFETVWPENPLLSEIKTGVNRLTKMVGRDSKQTNSMTMTSIDKVQGDDALYVQAKSYAIQGHEIYNRDESEINPVADALYQQSLDYLLSIKEKNFRTYYLMGMTCQWLGKHDDALQYLDRSLDDPNNKEYRQQATYWKAITLWEGFERKEEALRLFWLCFDQESEVARKFNILDWIMRIYVCAPVDHEGIKKWMDSIKPLVPDDIKPDLPFIFYVLQLKKDENNFDQLWALINLGLTFETNDIPLLIEKAECLSKLGNKEQAKVILEQLEMRSDKMQWYQAKRIENLMKAL